MSDAVKPKRAYRSPRRSRQAEETRQAILAAAAGLFVARGWNGTTVAEIAHEAGVSAETVYAAFGQKRAILRNLVRMAVRGSAADVPLLEQRGPSAVLAETSQRRLIAAFANDIAAVLERVAPLVGVVADAAASNAEMAELLRDLHDGRRRNLAPVAEALAGLGSLRGGVDAATATIWRLASPELFLLMTRMEAMPVADYRDWLDATLAAALIPN